MSQFYSLYRVALVLLSLGFVFTLSSCAGTKSGGSDFHHEDGGGGGEARVPKASADEVKKAETEALRLSKENHDMRREIFELKNRLGIPVEQPEDKD